MVTKTLVREAVTPFMSRLFANPGILQMSEISEFQAQNWRLGDNPIHFHTVLAGPPVGDKIASYFQNLSNIYPTTENAVRGFRSAPCGQGTTRKFSLAVMSIQDTAAKTPLGMLSLAMDLKRPTSGKPDWLLDIELEAICIPPHRPEPAIEHMLCAGVADLLYDELSNLNRQANEAGTRGNLNVGLSYSNEFSPLQLFAGRLRGEIDTMGRLINHGVSASKEDGLRILPVTMK